MSRNISRRVFFNKGFMLGAGSILLKSFPAFGAGLRLLVPCECGKTCGGKDLCPEPGFGRAFVVVVDNGSSSYRADHKREPGVVGSDGRVEPRPVGLEIRFVKHPGRCAIAVVAADEFDVRWLTAAVGCLSPGDGGPIAVRCSQPVPELRPIGAARCG